MTEKIKKRGSRWKKILLILGGLLAVFLIYFLSAIYIAKPEIQDSSILNVKRLNPAPNYYTFGNSWLKKNEHGLWEMYIEGNGFERGVAIGKLTQELAERQETVFIQQIKKLIPSEGYLQFLKFFVAYFNRHLPEHITPEYQQEIYGVSLFATDKYDHLAPKYYRILNYHAAHDIGHALQDKNMTVGCTSFAAKNSKTVDGNLVVGRNFDFYSGDEFAENKIIVFCNPDSGYKFSYVTWAGFTGVVSGMNNQGLTVTINASKSEIPTSAATPISLLAKEILQYAKNINEAFLIAKKRKVFVSESILIASQQDGKAYIIEKSPSVTALYEENKEILICSNHFQSKAFESDPVNIKNQAESSSAYRKKRMQELLAQHTQLDELQVAEILRDQRGLKNQNIGLTNEKGINQLIAHHAVIFKPAEQLFWVSTQPFQLGKFLAYDLNKVFAAAAAEKGKNVHFETDKIIPADPFLATTAYQNFLRFKQIKIRLQNFDSEKDQPLPEKLLQDFIKSNPEYYHTYWLIGEYYQNLQNCEKALTYFKLALTKEIATNKEKTQIQEAIKECKEQ